MLLSPGAAVRPAAQRADTDRPLQTASDVVRLFMRADKRQKQQATATADEAGSLLPAAYDVPPTGASAATQGIAARLLAETTVAQPLTPLPPGVGLSAFRMPTRPLAPPPAHEDVWGAQGLAAASTLPSLGLDAAAPPPRYNLCDPASASATPAAFAAAAGSSAASNVAAGSLFGSPLLSPPSAQYSRASFGVAPEPAAQWAAGLGARAPALAGRPSGATKRGRDAGLATADGDGAPSPGYAGVHEGGGAAPLGDSTASEPAAKAARRAGIGGAGSAPLATSSASCRAAHRILRTLEMLDLPPIQTTTTRPAMPTFPPPTATGAAASAAPAAALTASGASCLAALAAAPSALAAPPPLRSCVDITPARAP